MLEHMILHFLRTHFPVQKVEEHIENNTNTLVKMREPPCPIVAVPIPQGTVRGHRLQFQYNGVILGLEVPKTYNEPGQSLRVELPWDSLLSNKNYNGKDRGIKDFDHVAKRWRLQLVPINPTQSPQEIAKIKKILEKAREELCVKAKSLNLPQSALDTMISSLGGKAKVAEMTGRRRRVCDGNVEIRGGNLTNKDSDEINLAERRRFMNGDKLVAIISDAASTGISLHADRGCLNQRRRVHITLELAWSAEKAIQQLGRSHRSNASSAPSYELVVSDLAGETRFVSAVARRLESLGAITRGDRR